MNQSELKIDTDLTRLVETSTHKIQLLFAIESGSRAWGFASPDSDYDVRFIYANRPEWYIERALYHPDKRPDTRSFMTEDKLYDYHGWDLLKTLNLLKKCNPSLMEWLQSPIVYRQMSVQFVEELKELAAEAWSPVPAFFHYKSMAHTNFREHFRGDLVRTKKYLYVLRPILAARYIVNNLSQPPLNFDELVDQSDWLGAATREAIHNLLALKRSSSEVKDGPRNKVLHDFIETQFIDLGILDRTAAHFGSHIGKVDPEMFTDFLHRWLSAVWE